MAQPQDTGRAPDEAGFFQMEEEEKSPDDEEGREQRHPGFMTFRRFCDWADVGLTKAYELAGAGEIEVRRFGARSLINRASAEAWAARLPKWRSTKAKSQPEPQPAQPKRPRKRAA